MQRMYKALILEGFYLVPFCEKVKVSCPFITFVCVFAVCTKACFFSSPPQGQALNEK